MAYTNEQQTIAKKMGVSLPTPKQGPAMESKNARKTSSDSMGRIGGIDSVAKKMSGGSQGSSKPAFKPTPPLKKASPKMLEKLKKEAPETLTEPMRNQFNSKEAHRAAMEKYKKYGNWASNK